MTCQMIAKVAHVNELSETEIEIWNLFYAMRKQLDRALERDLQAHSAVSAPEFEILRALAQVPDGRLRVTDVAARVSWEQSRVSHQAQRMLARGLIERTADVADRRTAWISLTPDGKRAALEAMPERTVQLRKYFFDVLSPQEQAQLADMSRRVLGALGTEAVE